MATITSISLPSLKCQNCGELTAQIDEDEHCPVCRLESLSMDEQEICALLDVVCDQVRAAVVNSCVHPEDLRREIERTLSAPDLVEYVPDRCLLEDVRAARLLQAARLREAVAS